MRRQQAPSRSESFQRENMEPVLEAVGRPFSASTPTVTQGCASPPCSLHGLSQILSSALRCLAAAPLHGRSLMHAGRGSMRDLMRGRRRKRIPATRSAKSRLGYTGFFICACHDSL